MKLIHKKTDWDSIALLLSADWFLPHWLVVGLDVSERKRVCLSHELRGVVLDMLEGETRYLGIDFSETRIARTRKRLAQVIHEKTGIIAETMFSSEVEPEEDGSWIVTAITEQLLGNSNGNDTPALPILTLAAIAQARADAGQGEMTFAEFKEMEQESLLSPSKWDQFLISLKMDQPTWITDWLFVKLSGVYSPSTFWRALGKRLVPKQFEEVRMFYVERCRTLLGSDGVAQLPKWMMSH